MRRVVGVIAYGLAGLLVTGALTAGAWALAGKDISQPTAPTTPLGLAHPSPKPTEPIASEREDHPHATGSSSASSDDLGGSSDAGTNGARATPVPDHSSSSDGTGSSDISGSSGDTRTGSRDEGGDD